MENNWTSTPSRPSPTRSDKRGFSPGWALLVLLGLVVVYFVPPLLALLVLPHNAVVDQKNVEAAFPPDSQLIAQIVTYLPVALYLLAVLPPLAHASLAALGIRKPTTRDIVVGLIGAPAMWLSAGITETFLQSSFHTKATEAAIALLDQLHGTVEKAAFVVVAVVLAPLIEELMFRVFLLNAIRRFAPAWAAIVASGLLFGLVHVTNFGSLSQILIVGAPLAVSGMVLGAVYVRTKCYWSSVITHGLFNAANVFALVVIGVKG